MRYLRGIVSRWRCHGSVGSTRQGTGHLGLVGIAVQEAIGSFPSGGSTPRPDEAATSPSAREYPQGERLIPSSPFSPRHGGMPRSGRIRGVIIAPSRLACDCTGFMMFRLLRYALRVTLSYFEPRFSSAARAVRYSRAEQYQPPSTSRSSTSAASGRFREPLSARAKRTYKVPPSRSRS